MDTKLAAIIVHDIKNALALLEAELRDMTAAPEHQRAVHAHGTCLALQEKLIGFLTLYKASSQGLIAHVEAHSPEDFLHTLATRNHFHRAGVRLSVIRQDMPHIGFFDEHLVALALEAALQNAMRFARSSIDIGCRQERGSLVFSIRDDGEGIGAQEDASSTGLGMSLCNAIAQAHVKGEKRGRAMLDNHPEGGAVFELCLP